MDRYILSRKLSWQGLQTINPSLMAQGETNYLRPDGMLLFGFYRLNMFEQCTQRCCSSRASSNWDPSRADQGLWTAINLAFHCRTKTTRRGRSRRGRHSHTWALSFGRGTGWMVPWCLLSLVPWLARTALKSYNLCESGPFHVMPGEILQRPSQMPCGSGDRCVACPEWATLDLASKSMNFCELRSRNTKEHFWTLQDVFRPRHRDCSIPWLRPPPVSAKDKVAKVCWCTGFTLAWPKLPTTIISGIYGNKGWR